MFLDIIYCPVLDKNRTMDNVQKYNTVRSITEKNGTFTVLQVARFSVTTLPFPASESVVVR
jgi:hypothetical protein